MNETNVEQKDEKIQETSFGDTITMPETPDTDSMCEVTDLESKAAESKLAIRGVVKKLFRTFKDEQKKIFEAYTFQVANVLENRLQNTFKKMDEALAKLDLESKKRYSMLLRQVFFNLERKVFTVDITMKALMEEVAQWIYQLNENQKTFNMNLSHRINTIEAILNEMTKNQNMSPLTAEMIKSLRVEHSESVAGFDESKISMADFQREFENIVYKRADEVATEVSKKAQEEQLAKQSEAVKQDEPAVAPETKEDVAVEQKEPVAGSTESTQTSGTDEAQPLTSSIDAT